MSIIITRAEVSDAEGISRLLRLSMKGYCEASGIPEGFLEAMTESVETVADRIRNQRCFVIKSSGLPVATVTLESVSNPLKLSFSSKTEEFLAGVKEQSTAGYISRFAVHPECQNLGYGEKLFGYVTDTAAVNLGIGVLFLHCSADNRRMAEFYKRRGFEVVDIDCSRGYPRALLAREIVTPSR